MTQRRTISRLLNVKEMQRYVQVDREHLWHPYTQIDEYSQRDPIIVEAGEGPYLIDIRKRRFLDAYGSMWCNVWGHCHPELVRALQEQAARLCHASLFSTTHVPALELCDHLVGGIRNDFRYADTPPTLNHVFFSDNGSTAVEVAMKMAMQYQNQIGQIQRTRFLVFREAYHGDTFGAMSAGGIDLFTRKFGPLLFEVLRADYPMQIDPDEPSEDRRAAERDLEALMAGQSDKLAAVVIEPVIQGVSGMRPLAEGFLAKVRKYCNEYGILMITDEVFVGVCRTGPLVASSEEMVEPDILCLGKGLTGGVTGMGVTVANDRVFEAFRGRWEEFRHFLHGHTYSGNPLACAAAIRNLEMVFEDALAAQVKTRARELSLALKLRVAKHPRVGPIRQRGLAVGIPILGPDGEERQGYEAREDALRVCRAMMKQRVLTRPLGNVITLVPPLNIGPEHVEEMVSALEYSLPALDAAADDSDVEPE